MLEQRESRMAPDAVVQREEPESGSGLRSELRGMDYATGAARLAPVQLEQAQGAGGEGAEGDVQAGPEDGAKSFGHWLQSVLNRTLEVYGLLDKPLKVDGIIGARTHLALKKFQDNIALISPDEGKLPRNGVVDPATLGAIERTIGKPNPFGRKSSPRPDRKPEWEDAEGPPEAAAMKQANKDEARAEAAAKDAKGDGKVATPAEGGIEEIDVPVAAETRVRVAEEVQAEQAKDNKCDGSETELEEKMRARLESARKEEGKIAEREFFTPPAHMRAGLHAAFYLRIEKNKAAAKPGDKPGGVWFAKDQASLDRLNELATNVQLDYEKTAVEVGYQWCGSFIAGHYGMDAKFTFIADKKKGAKNPSKATANGNMYLASTPKSYDFFNYVGEWNGAYARDKNAPATAPFSEAYQPIRAYHAAHGGERAWLPVDEWKSNPAAVLRPGMVLFVHPTQKFPHGAHMIFVDHVTPDGKGGWQVHTFEGNAPGAKVAPAMHAIGADGKTGIHAVARPAFSDFDTTIDLCDSDWYARQVQEEGAK